jgi:hypothetical protein
MRYIELHGIIVDTNAGWLAREEEIGEKQLGYNIDTGDLVAGPGMYADLLTPKAPIALRVAAVATSNVTIASGLNAGDTVGGKVLEEGDVVLLTGETAGETNGPYVAGATPARHSNFDTFNSIAGKSFFCEGGTNKGKTYLNTNASGGTLGTTPITFNQVRGELLSLSSKGQLSNLTEASSVTNSTLFLAQDPVSGELVQVSGFTLKAYVNA